MKKLLTISMVLLGMWSLPILAKETTMEKAEVKTNDITRSAKKKINRIKEKICKRSDYECLRLKAKYRAQEAKDALKDKKEEIKNKIND